MTRTALAHTDGSIAYGGTWATNTDTGTFTGSYRVSANSGDTITITVPATATAVILRGLAYHNGAAAVQVQSKVGGVVTATTVWNLWKQLLVVSLLVPADLLHPRRIQHHRPHGPGGRAGHHV
jgi:hypothetical protein